MASEPTPDEASMSSITFLEMLNEKTKRIDNRVAVMQIKEDETKRVIEACAGKKGVWASTKRYNNQCWTRDICISMKSIENVPLLTFHFLNIAKNQADSGRVPILFIDDVFKFVENKTANRKDDKPSFMLTRFKEGKIGEVTPHTRDSEMHFIIAISLFMLQWRDSISPDNLAIMNNARMKAFNYVDSVLTQKKGLVQGSDWRDTLHKLDKETVLTNACLLFCVYQTMGYEEKAMEVKKVVNERFWNGKYYKNFPDDDSEVLDLYGNSLAIIHGLFDKEEKPDLILKEILDKHQTNFGFLMAEVFLPALTEEEAKVMEEEKAVIWPFVNGHVLLAMLGTVTRALTELIPLDTNIDGNKIVGLKRKIEDYIDIVLGERIKWDKLNGVYEWYSIKSGKGFGSENQLWSAAIYCELKAKLELVQETYHKYLQKEGQREN